MRVITLLFVLVLTQNCFSQDKEETKDWIKDKLESYLYTNPPGDIRTLNVSFEGENMILSLEESVGTGTVYWKRTIPIKKLKELRFSEKERTIWILLSVKGGDLIEERVSSAVKKGDSMEVYAEEEIQFKNEIVLIMSKDILENNLKERLQKAFTNLIKYYGGTTEAY